MPGAGGRERRDDPTGTEQGQGQDRGQGEDRRRGQKGKRRTERGDRKGGVLPTPRVWCTLLPPSPWAGKARGSTFNQDGAGSRGGTQVLSCRTLIGDRGVVGIMGMVGQAWQDYMGGG